VEFSSLNDWIAFAPVFSDDKTSGASLSARQMMQNDDKTRSFLRNGKYVAPLPGTEMEVNDIFKKFDFKHLKASVQLYGNANENFIKSAELSKYKIIHFATHGFVNSEKPELSGILLMQDTLHGNDGILYSGEIYNLNLNADLVVLSACETGLGKIAKGEGVIGLTRALLYAGSRNIIVSLWQVSDASTKELMINFYDNLLIENKIGTSRVSYSKHLQKAKLKLISEKKYSHPFFWSPFILIGK
jgi:CHAT domain-containing protein